jgi:hypothetical protein
MTDCSPLCRLCFKKEAMVCPECMNESIQKEVEQSNKIISALQDDYIKPNWPGKYRHD